jgi:hypothetical protein
MPQNSEPYRMAYRRAGIAAYQVHGQKTREVADLVAATIPGFARPTMLFQIRYPDTFESWMDELVMHNEWIAGTLMKCPTKDWRLPQVSRPSWLLAKGLTLMVELTGKEKQDYMQTVQPEGLRIRVFGVCRQKGMAMAEAKAVQ